MTQPAALSDEDVGTDLMAVFGKTRGPWTDVAQTWVPVVRRARELLGGGMEAVPADVKKLADQIERIYIEGASTAFRGSRAVADYIIQRYGAPPTSSDPTLEHDAEKLGAIMYRLFWDAPGTAQERGLRLGTYVLNLQRALREDNTRLRGALEGMIEEFDGRDHASAGDKHKPTCACCVALKQAAAVLAPGAAEAPGCEARWEIEMAAPGSDLAEKLSAAWEPYAVVCSGATTIHFLKRLCRRVGE